MNTLEQQGAQEAAPAEPVMQEQPETPEQEIARVMRMSQQGIAAYFKTATEEQRQDILFAMHVIHG